MQKLMCSLVVTWSCAALLAVPAHTQDMTCPHREDTLAGLSACIEHALDVGHIENAGVAQSLLAKIDAAEALLANGDTRGAIATLTAFIAEVEGLAGRLIDLGHAAHIVAHAERVIASLSA